MFILDNGRLYLQQRHVAEALQRSLLTALPHLDEPRLAARYTRRGRPPPSAGTDTTPSRSPAGTPRW